MIMQMKNSASDRFYNGLSLLYPLVDFFLRPQKRQLFDKINDYPDGVLLDIGVGNGSHLTLYTRHQVVGIDTSAGMLAHAQKHVRPNIRLLQMNGEALSFPNELFDYVVLSHVIAVVNDADKLLQEVYRVLKPNGKVFILNHFTPENGLKYVDMTFAGIARLLHFRSTFHINDIGQINAFRLVSESNAGMFSYFKIMIYEKNL